MKAPRATIGVVTNPNSKKNRLRPGRAERLQAIVGEAGVVRETQTVAAIRPTVEEFIGRGVRYWVSDGGDGALFWLVNEAREALGKGAGLPLIVPTNGGTIDFVAKKVGIRGQAEDILERLVRVEREGGRHPETEVPSFIVEGREVDPSTGAERRFEKIGFAGAIAGIGQRFFDKYYLDPLPGRTTVLKVIAKGLASLALGQPGLRALPGIPASWRAYGNDLIKGMRARVRVDGRPLEGEEWNAIHVGSIYVDLGGVVKLFRLAGSGKLHVMAGNPGVLAVVRNVPHLFTGGRMPNEMFEAAAETLEVEATGDEPLAPVIDGEVFRGLRSVRVTPGPRVRIPQVGKG